MSEFHISDKVKNIKLASLKFNLRFSIEGAILFK